MSGRLSSDRDYPLFFILVTDPEGREYWWPHQTIDTDLEKAVLSAAHRVTIQMQREGWRIREIHRVETVDYWTARPIPEHIANPIWEAAPGR